MLTKQKQLAESVMEPLVKPFAKVNPNILTLIGSIPPLLFFVFVINHWYVAALIAFVGNAFDLIDGLVARAYKKVTAFGGFLDSLIDRIGDFLMITPFAFAGIVRWEIVAPLLLSAFLTSYIRSRGELAKRDVSFAVGIVERTERLLFIWFALLIHVLMPQTSLFGFHLAELFFILILALSLFTVMQRIVFAYKHL